MCGITGFLDPRGAAPADDLRARVARMADALAHRGPDDAGTWVDPRCGVALGHRRLAILDVSPLGHQPMISSSGRYVVSYNGEIYNYRELRAELAAGGATFHGQSDTSVLLEAVERWGFADSLRRLNGMFAIALWDREERQLLLARDRFGEKPLYYGHSQGMLFFASELKALHAHPSFHGEIDPGAIAQFLRFLGVPAPSTIFSNVRKLPAGCWTVIGADGEERGSPRPYWSMVELALAGEREPFGGTEVEAVDTLERLLRASVRARMVADVPLGAFLSGGIDSSTVVALMQAESGRPIRTFTIGLEEAGYDEAESARAIARHLGTDHTELYVTPGEALTVIPRLPTLYDEPFADASQIPTFLVAQLARRHVTVALSGDGGDELFGGYNRHVWGEPIWRALAPFPVAGRRLAASALDRVQPEWVDLWAGRLEGVLPEGMRHRQPGQKLQKIASLLRVADRQALLVRLLSAWKDPRAVLAADGALPALLAEGRPPLRGFTEQMMCTDALLYLPDDILAKVDRATMGVSLEARVPMLDPEVAGFAFRLPRQHKVRGRTSKRVLRDLLARYVPRGLFERPKMGFSVPIGEWLRGALRPWAEEELGDAALARTGHLAAPPIRRMWREHLERRRDWHMELWAILMFQAWHRHWSGRPSSQAALRGPLPEQALGA